MENSSYDIEDVYKEIKKVDDCLQIDITSRGGGYSNNELYIDYCPNKNGKRQCETICEKISAGFIWLLITLEHLCDDVCPDIENEKYAEYAILWLNYKLNQISNEGITTLKKFYTKHIKDNKGHVNYKDHLDDKINSMDINIKDISNIYEAFEILCKMYTVYNESDQKCTNCSQNAKEFVQKIEEFNKGPSITGNESYSKILSTLSDDYNYLKKYYADNCSECSNIPNFPEINSQKNSHNSLEKSGQDRAQDNVDTSVPSSLEGRADNSMHVSEFTSSSSSVASKLIPVLSIFAISFFLGIAYKYSLFGFDKRRHRQYLREKVKNIKKKMASYV